MTKDFGRSPSGSGISNATKIDARYGYLDHLERHGVGVRASVLRDVRGIALIRGDIADLAGNLALRELADELGEMIRIDGPSDYHAGMCFLPRDAVGEAQGMLPDRALCGDIAVPQDQQARSRSDAPKNSNPRSGSGL